MSTTTTQRVELPPGYTVVDRLGAGGYGEVWKAVAPGGLEKAVKIVFGHCDECMAERELKSLDRIKSVRHPFLLSIERYEIVNNRLVIVTELADMSLSDCFQAHVAAGRAGIPRDQLIAYLWDAADALDCLLEHHSLQHLDIKPENLLVVGDHIKVADFGLVKELASKTLNSVMGGMTPLYSAPEIYDNKPSPRSDQYSLAIVYQHMLTATLPFSGKTPAQLAKQHTLAQPNVNPLSEADRAIVRRALEKNPRNRFASCREFVSALRSAGMATPVSISSPTPTSAPAPPRWNPSDDTRSVSLIDTKQIRDPICIAATQKLGEVENAIEDLQKIETGERFQAVHHVEFPPVDSEIVDVEVPEIDNSVPVAPVPTLFVGIGGVGIKLLTAVRSRAADQNCEQQVPLAWLAIDTERETLKATYAEDERGSLSADDKLHIPLRRPNQYRDDSQALLQWVSRRWLYNIPRSQQTRGFRPLGRIAIVDHAAEVLTALQSRLHRLMADHQNSVDPQPTVRVVILAGMSGGTGGGTAIDVAQAVRALARDFACNLQAQAVLGCTYHAESNDSLAAANMYSFLTELAHAQAFGNCGESPPPGPASLYEADHQPFDEIYVVSLNGGEGRSDCGLAVQSVADYLLLNASGAIEPASRALRCSAADETDHLSLRTFSCIDLGQMGAQHAVRFQQAVLRDIIESWFTEETSADDPDARFFQDYRNSRFAQTVLKRIPVAAAPPSSSTSESEIEAARARRSAKIKCIAQAFLEFVSGGPSPTSELQLDSHALDADAMGQRIIAKICEGMESGGPSDAELTQRMHEFIEGELAQLVAPSGTNDGATLAQTALGLFAAGPLDCGYKRYSLLVEPQDRCDAALLETLRERCPTVATFTASVNSCYLLREGSGLEPLHLGARLAELYPDIAEAASRLHARNDLNWMDLRASVAKPSASPTNPTMAGLSESPASMIN